MHRVGVELLDLRPRRRPRRPSPPIRRPLACAVDACAPITVDVAHAIDDLDGLDAAPSSPTLDAVAREPTEVATRWWWRPITGPAVDAARPLEPGTVVLGRSRDADLVVDDPGVEPHHLVLDVTAEGVRCTPVAGRLAVRVDGRPVRLGTTATLGPAGGTIRIGTSVAELRPERGSTVATPADDQPIGVDRLVVRRPRPVPTSPAVVVDEPVPPVAVDVPPPSGTLLVTAITSLVLGIVMAAVLGHALFVLFSVAGALVSGGTWVSGRVRRARARRRHRVAVGEFAAERRRRHDDAVAASRRRLLDHPGDVADVVARAGTLRTWERRPCHGDAFDVVVGRGDLRLPVVRSGGSVGPVGPVDHDVAPTGSVTGRLEGGVPDEGLVRDVPVSVPLAPPGGAGPRVVAVSGPGAHDLVRSMLVQLAVTTGPADWRLVRPVGEGGLGGWCDGVPHLVDPSSRERDASRSIDTGPPAGGPRTVLVVDEPAEWSSRDTPMRRLLDREPDVTVLLVVPDHTVVPAIADTAIHTGSAGTARWCPDLRAAVDGWPEVRIATATVSQSTAQRVASVLHGLVDAEELRADEHALPERVELHDLGADGVVPIGVEAVRAAWAVGGRDPRPVAVLGRSSSGIVSVDLVRDGPHALLAGTTGSGKSELLRTLVVSLALGTAPEHLQFVLVDYKGGAAFDACAGLPHTAAVVTDLDPGSAARALVGLDAELRRRERLLRTVGAADLTAYRSVEGTAPLARLVIVIDELAALVSEVPGFVPALVALAQRGRSLGMHLVLATQRPAGVVDDSIRANTDLRLALRLQDPADGRDVVGDALPASFPRAAPGRAVLTTSSGDAVVFQSAICSAAVRPTDAPVAGDQLGAAVDAAVRAVRADAREIPPAPWLPALHDLGPLTRDRLRALLGEHPCPDGTPALGVLDDPAAQRHRPVVVDTTANLLLIGSPGSGATEALTTIARHGVLGLASLSVIDAVGSGSLEEVADLGHCVGVVPPHDTERCWRLLQRLADIIEARRADRSWSDVDEPERHLLVVHGLAAWRRTLDAPEHTEIASLVDRVLVEGPPVGVVTVASSAPGVGLASVLGRFGRRWVFALDDPADAPLVGVPVGRVPGPGTFVDLASGLDGRLLDAGTEAVRAGDPVLIDGSRSVQRIEVLPELVRPDDVDRTDADRAVVDPGVTRLALGRRYRDLTTATVDLHEGEHLLVVGPPRSGRTSALRAIARAWSVGHPDGSVIGLDGRDRTGGASLDHVVEVIEGRGDAPAPGRFVLVLVDHADRVDDPTGRFATLLATAAPGLTVVAAARGDDLRHLHGHWTSIVRRSRLGLVLTGGSELDGELLGAVLPRRLPLRPRPGLGWLVGHHGTDLVQTVFAEAHQSSGRNPRRQGTMTRSDAKPSDR